MGGLGIVLATLSIPVIRCIGLVITVVGFAWAIRNTFKNYHNRAFTMALVIGAVVAGLLFFKWLPRFDHTFANKDTPAPRVQSGDQTTQGSKGGLVQPQTNGKPKKRAAKAAVVDNSSKVSGNQKIKQKIDGNCNAGTIGNGNTTTINCPPPEKPRPTTSIIEKSVG